MTTMTYKDAYAFLVEYKANFDAWLNRIVDGDDALNRKIKIAMAIVKAYRKKGIV